MAAPAMRRAYPAQAMAHHRKAQPAPPLHRQSPTQVVTRLVATGPRQDDRDGADAALPRRAAAWLPEHPDRIGYAGLTHDHTASSQNPRTTNAGLPSVSNASRCPVRARSVASSTASRRRTGATTASDREPLRTCRPTACQARYRATRQPDAELLNHRAAD
jgi:hypothetical protein